MNGSHGIATRIGYATAILLALIMLGVPSFFMGDGSFELAENAAAADGIDVDRNYIIAVSELTLDTLNPNTYTMVSEGLVIFPVYSYLLQYDLDLNVIGDAAREWSSSPDGMLWNFKLWDDIYFIDPADPDDLTHTLTAEDVIYTFMSLQNSPSSRLYSYFPGILEDMWATDGDPLDLWIQLNVPFASIMDSWLGMPILPKYYWDEGTPFVDFENDPPIGSGPYYYNITNDASLGSVKLNRNDHWYMTDNFGWQIHTDAIILKEEINEDGALSDLENGEIDVLLRVEPSLYLNTLPTLTNVARFSQTKGFVYEFNLNQMTDELRAELGWTEANAYNSQVLLLEPVRMAFAMSVDKEAFVEEVQEGLGSPACSLIPERNRWHWEVPEEDTIPVSTTDARDLLNANGWIYDELGNLNTEATPLARKNATTGAVEDVLSFRYYTLDTAEIWELAAKKIAGWCAESGIYLDLDIKSVSVMNTIWYTGNYDVWLWDWDMGVLADGAGIMEVLTSMSIGSSSDVYWVNETYDDLYTESLYCMDPVTRAELIDEMQRMAYEQMGCQCVAYSADNYGVSTKTWALESMGDWNNTYYILPDVWYQWLAMQLYPKNNHAPTVTLPQVDIDTTVGAEVSFATSAEDDGTNGLLYRWFFGDGTKTDWNTAAGTTHTYTEDGYYDVWVAVREDGPSANDYNDNFTTVDNIKVTVRDMSNDPPAGLEWSFLPLDPDCGDAVTFTGSATDPEGDELYYTWDFGGGHLLGGPEVQYQFETDGFNSVTMYVTDNHLGTGERPVSLPGTVEVRENYAPWVDVPTFTDKATSVEESYTIDAGDADDEVRLTWYWGDDTVSVTTTPTTTHTYDVKGEYTLTVWVDDRTGLDNHNISDSNTVFVYNPAGNAKPNIQTFTVSDATPYTDEVVTFSGSATDGDGDPLTLTVAFGDGTFATQAFPATEPNDIVSWTTTHAYEDDGSYTAVLYVDDREANVSEQAMRISITVSTNYPPDVSVPEVSGSTGVSTAFSATTSDLDGDTLQFYWDWADGTYSATSTGSTSHTYAVSDDYVYGVWVDDGHGHNVSDFNYAHINAIPTVENVVDFSWEVDLEHQFAAVGDDADDEDDLTYTWDFDGTIMVGVSVAHTFLATGTYNCAVYVDDGFALASHNVSDSFVVTVVASGVNLPPEVQDLLLMEESVDEVVTFTATASDPNGDPITYEWDFGDASATELGQTVTHVYDTAGDYTYSVTVTDDGGLFTTKSNTITIVADALPIADAGDDQTVDEDTTVTFDAAGSDDDVGIDDYEWTIPSVPATLTDVDGVATYEFAEPGVYTVVLEVTDTIDQTDTDELIVTVRDVTAPTAVPLATPSVIDMGGMVELDGSGSTDNVADSIGNWTWVFFDGSAVVTIYGEIVEYTFDYAGEFSVELTVRDAADNEGDASVVVTVNDIVDPVAVATADPSPVNFGETVTLDGSESTDNVEDSIWNWTWDISLDSVVETTLYGEIVTYEFEDLGDYDVTLTVKDEAENTDSMTIVVTSEDSNFLSLDRQAFSASDSTDNHEIASYVWTFDYDGATETLTGVAQTFTFGIAGEYLVTLNVTDVSGNWDTVSVTITVESGPPVADAGADASMTVGTEHTFDGSGSSADVDNYTWTFVYDGATVTLYGEAPVFTFDIAGVYTVTLNVTDIEDLYDTDTVTITVTDDAENEPPVADAAADVIAITVGDTVTFDGSGSSADVDNYTWTFVYDGATVTLYGETPVFTFDIAGVYTVTLSVSDVEGLTDTDTVTITVEADDSPSFIETYGLVIGIVAAIVVAAAVAMMLMKRKGGKGASSNEGVEGIDSGEPGPPAN